MTQKEITIKVTTEADSKELDDLENKITELSDMDNINVEVQTDDSSITDAQESIDELDNGVATVDLEIPTDDIDTAQAGIEGLNESINASNDNAENMKNNTDAIGESLDNASQMASELNKNMSDADENAEGLNNKLLESAIYLDVASQLGSIGANAEGMAEEMNNTAITVGQLATQTGIAEPQLRSMISYISNATFPQEEAMMYVKSLDQIGVSSQNLGKSATDLDKINDAFGMGAGKVNSLGQELSVLGVDMNNVSSSFNALAYANANTVGGMDNYYNFLRKYDAQFKELGFNVDQASVIIAGATQKFGGGRAALSGLSSALKESNGDTRALEEALGLQAGAITNATKLTGEYEGQLQTLADEEAEHKTLIEKLGAVYEDLTLQLEPILSPMMSFIGLVGQFAQFTVGINGIITLAQTLGILKEGQLALIPVQYAEGTAGWFSIGWIALAILLGLALGLALIYLWNNSEQFRNAVYALGDGIKWLATSIWNNLMNAINFARRFISNVATIFWNGALHLVDSFITPFKNLYNSMRVELQSIWQLVVGWMQPLIDLFSWLGSAIANAFSQVGLGQHSPGKLYRSMVLEFESIGDVSDDYGNILPSKFAGIGNNISDYFNPTLDNFEDNNLGNNLINGAGNNIEGMGKTEVNNIFNIDYLAKKEFVQEIIDIITNEIMWDNTTAGRVK